MNGPLPGDEVSGGPEVQQEAEFQREEKTGGISFLDLPGEIRNEIFDLAYTKVGGVTTIGASQKSKAPVVIRCRSDGCWLPPRRKRFYGEISEEVKVTFDLGLLLTNKQVYDEASSVLMGMFGRPAFSNSAPAYYDGRGNWEQRNTIWDHTLDFPDDGLRKMRRCRIVVFLDRNRPASCWHWAASEFDKVRDHISSLCDKLSKGHNLEHLDIRLVHSEKQTFSTGSKMIDERVLEPLARLRGIKRARVRGNVTVSWANWLQSRIMSDDGVELQSPPPVLATPAEMMGDTKSQKVSTCQDAKEPEERQSKETKHLLEAVEPAVEDLTKFLVAYDDGRQVYSTRAKSSLREPREKNYKANEVSNEVLRSYIQG